MPNNTTENNLFIDLYYTLSTRDDLYDGVNFALKHRECYASKLMFGYDLSRKSIEKRMLYEISQISIIEKIMLLSKIPICSTVCNYLQSLYDIAIKINLQPHEHCIPIILASRTIQQHQLQHCKGLTWNVQDYIVALKNKNEQKNIKVVKPNEKKCKSVIDKKEIEIVNKKNKSIVDEKRCENIVDERKPKKTVENKEREINDLCDIEDISKTITAVLDNNVLKNNNLSKEGNINAKIKQYEVLSEVEAENVLKNLNNGLNRVRIYAKCYDDKNKHGFTYISNSKNFVNHYGYEQLRSNSDLHTIIGKASDEILKYIIEHNFNSFIIYISDIKFKIFFKDLFYDRQMFPHTISSQKYMDKVIKFLHKTRSELVIFIKEDSND
uniref:NYN domain-containing protein n=1 Tax=Strongyloides venezuelensis TaxID=75913 RepID=A0A0K0FEH0_STRVS